ncbi:MAG: hypothetical protein ACRENJ_06405 [Candidatus Eiseniibacteriota bacterium]
MKTILLTVAVLALAGCGAPKQTAETAAQAPATPAANAGSDAAVAAAPNLIAELTDQTLIYECPKCGMMFDAAGTCSMGCGELVATQVAYSCPKDNQAVAKAGQCPRCPMNARVEKTAMAGGAAPSKN